MRTKHKTTITDNRIIVLTTTNFEKIELVRHKIQVTTGIALILIIILDSLIKSICVEFSVHHSQNMASIPQQVTVFSLLASHLLCTELYTNFSIGQNADNHFDLFLYEYTYSSAKILNINY